MKSNKFFMLGIVTVLVAVLSLTFVSNTFAKYTSTVTGQDTARVAKWAFDYGSNPIDLKTSKEVTFDLFNTAYTDANVDTNGLLDNATVIAPGTKGEFAFTVTNKSEVNAQYKISFVEVNASNIPVQYSLDGTTWYDDLAALNFAAAKPVNMSASFSHTVYWRWVFEGTTTGAHVGQTDEKDTLLGIDGAEITVKLNILFEQVD